MHLHCHSERSEDFPRSSVPGLPLRGFFVASLLRMTRIARDGPPGIVIDKYLTLIPPAVIPSGARNLREAGARVHRFAEILRLRLRMTMRRAS